MATREHIPVEALFINFDNVIDMYRLVDRFLAEHLGVRQEVHA